MPNITGGATVWNLPNLVGPLLSVRRPATPFLNMIGGVNGMKISKAVEFAIGQQFTLNSAAQPAIAEADSLVAPTPASYVPAQYTNVCQIFQHAVSISYARMADTATLLAGSLSVVGESNPIVDPLVQQQNLALLQVAEELEYTFLRGVYQRSTAADVPNKSRGMLAAVTSNAVDAGAQKFSKALMDQLLRTMAGNLAAFGNMILLANAFQLNQISNVYGYAPQDRNIGGVQIKVILTDFGPIGVQYTPLMPTDTMLVADIANIAPVAQEVPGKGVLFYEPLAKAGAGETGQIFGIIGLDHDVEYKHGKITNLATA